MDQTLLVSNLCQGLSDWYDGIARILAGRRVADDVGGGGRRVGVGRGLRCWRETWGGWRMSCVL